MSPPLTWPADQSPPPHLIEDSTLFTFLRCPRRAYLNTYGDASLQAEPSDYLMKLKGDSAVHRQTVLTEFSPIHRPSRHGDNLTAKAQATYDLMQQGVEHICRGTVAAINQAGTLGYVSQPDLWIKQAGTSWLGDWYYVPLDIKLGKKPKQEYQLTAAFHAYVLAAWQGVIPLEAHLRLRERHYAIDLEKQWPTLLELLEKCETVLTAEHTPDVFISRSRCDMCVWLNHCYDVAQSQNHLSLLPGVTLNRYRHLDKLGLTTVETLARNQPATLAQASGFELKVAEKLVHQAQAKLSGSAIARTDANNCFTLSPEELTQCPH